MNLKAIKAIETKAQKEAKKAIKQIYAKYNNEIKIALASQISKGQTLLFGNGLTILVDKKGNEIKSGKAWGLPKDEQLDYIASLQYMVQFTEGFRIKKKIKGNK